MLTNYDIVYYAIYLTCLFFCFKANADFVPGLKMLQLLIVLGFINEMIVEVLQFFKREENFPHFVYIPLEYVIFCSFLKQNTKIKAITNGINLSIVVYFFSTIALSFFYYKFKDLPSIVYLLNCFFSIVWIVLILFSFEINAKLTITSILVFWILISFLIFYSTVLLFFGAYNFLKQLDAVRAKDLRNHVNIVANYLLYLCLTYCFISSRRLRNFTHQ